MDGQAFLFATSAILGVEKIHGLGQPVAVTGFIPSVTSGWTAPTSTVVDQTTVYGGWDHRSYGDPTGAILIADTARADLETTYTPSLPTRTTYHSVYDTYGPTRTDILTDGPGTPPTLSGTSLATWYGSLSMPTAPVQNTSTFARHWDDTLGRLFKDSEHGILTGSALPSLRSGATSVDFGTTTYSYSDPLGRLTSTSLARDVFVSLEARTYQGTNPQPLSIKKSLTQNGAPVPASAALGNVVGKTFTYDSTPFQWLATETDIADGRPFSVLTRDDLGRIRLSQDTDGIQTQTDYDGWGRLKNQSRLTGPSLVKTTTYDPSGMPIQLTVKADGRSLVTTSTYDGFGRVVGVVNPDGSSQSTVFNGFREKYAQSPLLIAGETSYGNYTWIYDGKGRLTTALDPQNRVLTSIPADPACNSAQMVVSQTFDDRNYSRTTYVDLLGQKRTLIDQKGQETDFSYDGDGHLIETLQNSQVRRYSYNPMGWLMSRTEPEEGSTFYSQQNLLGTPQLVTQTGRLGASQETTGTTLDAHLRPTIITTDSGATVSIRRTITYDSTFYVPSQITEDQPYGSMTETYTLDGLGRTTGKTIQDGTQSFTISQTLDALGNVTSLTYPSGGTQSAPAVAYGFDGAARPISASLGGNLRGSYDYGEDHLHDFGFDTLLSYGAGGLGSTTTTFNKGEVTQVVQTYAGGSATLPVSWTAGGLMLTRGADSYVYDELQRLTQATTQGVGGTVTQSFAYDRWGNRIQNRWSGNHPNEAVAWNATYDATNSLPAQIMLVDPTTGNPTYAVSTNAIYDDLGRISQVNAIPGDPTSLTQWGYDGCGRVVNENGSTFLLDGQGLRFRRTNPDGTVLYTVYGFHAEPLSVFTANPQAKTQARKLSPTQSLAITGSGACDAFITSPAGNTTVWVGQTLTLSGYDDSGAPSTLSWAFGDGRRSIATGATVTHAYTAAGTFTVVLSASATGWTSAAATVVITVVAAPTLTLTSSPGTIVQRDATTLAWSVTGGAASDTRTLTPAPGAVAASGQSVQQPLVTTTYTLTVANAMGSLSKAITVVVDGAPPPVIQTFAASSISLLTGQSSTLNWTVTSHANWPATVTLASFCQDNPTVGSQVSVAASSALVVTPLETTVYTLTATLTSGATAVSQVTVVVVQKPIIEAFWASSNVVAPGQGTTLHWGVTNFTSLTLSGTGTVNGTSITVTQAAQTTYTLTATNAAGSTSASLVVFSGSPATSALTWVRTMVYGFGQLLSEETPSGTTYVLTDQVGSPNLILNPQGTLVGTTSNLPFGERFGSWGTQSARRFTNHEDEPGSAIYMQARMYLPAYGKFAQVDPAYDQMKEDPESWNLYNYVTNNPVTHTDIDGREDNKAVVREDSRNNPLNACHSYQESEAMQADPNYLIFSPIVYYLNQSAQADDPNGNGTSTNEVAATGNSTGIKELKKGEIEKTDHLVGDDKGLKAAKDLEKLAGYGLHQTERGVWFVFDAEGKFVYAINWPWSASNNKNRIPDLPPVPEGYTVEMGHTHPFLGGRTQHPSEPQDINACTERNMNGYVFSRNGVYRIENPSGNVTAVAGPGWWE